jgi:hypothetical protein
MTFIGCSPKELLPVLFFSTGKFVCSVLEINFNVSCLCSFVFEDIILPVMSTVSLRLCDYVQFFCLVS